MRFVAIDVETANPNMASICQIGIVRFDDGVEVAAERVMVDPETWFDPCNVSIHGIDEDQVQGAATFAALRDWLEDWTRGEIVVCHTHFDRVSLRQACEQDGLEELACTWLDSARVCRRTWSQFAERGYGLANVARFCGVDLQHHDALHDARAAGLILVRACAESGLDPAGWVVRIAKREGSRNDVSRIGDGDGALVGETIVFTGALQVERRRAADMAAHAGADVAAGVTKHTTMLVVGDQDIAKLHGQEKSSKHRKAETLIAAGQMIRVIGETDFMALSAITD